MSHHSALHLADLGYLLIGAAKSPPPVEVRFFSIVQLALESDRPSECKNDMVEVSTVITAGTPEIVAEEPKVAAERVLIVEDDAAARVGLEQLVRSWGFIAESAGDGEEALEKVTSFRPAIVITDMVMPRMDGLALLRALPQTGADVTTLLLTAQGTVDTAVEAMKEGAYDYLTKPVDIQRLKILLDKIVERLETMREVKALRRQLREHGTFGSLVGNSAEMRKIYQVVEQAAPTSASVLITGESGTGKELIAQTIHQLSPRANFPFIAINCAAIPETLLETELFGYEKGAFTGAGARKPGRFEMAHRGTLFLDEIGDLPLTLKAKILRALEEKRFERVGGTQQLHVDVRVVAATNRNLKARVADRQFREDLYFRLSVFPVQIPPLRERPGDIMRLARHFVDKICRDVNKKPLMLSDAAVEELCSYAWPGNVRELQNCIERAVILTEGDTIQTRHLSLSFRQPGPPLTPPVAPTNGSAPPAPSQPSSPWDQIDLSGTMTEALRRVSTEVERRKIEQALKDARGSKSAAADILQVGFKALGTRMRQLGIPEP
jgi:DNA-binding NtrC family response regulator